MKLKYVSITGADDTVDVEGLNALAADYPFVESAVLLLPESMGKARFPTLSWLKDFTRHYQGAYKAMHLCGSAFLDFVAGKAEILGLMEGFERIQLNLNFGDVAGKYEPAQLIEQMKSRGGFEFIIQYSAENEALLPLLQDVPNHAVLFDESAGTGTSPDQWPAPLPGHFCGYAGGLSPDNLAQNLERIAAATGDDYTTWIDMESGVRTDDRFDLDKVRQVLEIVDASDLALTA